MKQDAISGGCQCGAVRYRLVNQDYKIYVCHCLECQKHTSSAFALSMPVKFEDMEVQGALENYTRGTDSGAKTRCAFCPACGTRLYHRSDKSPEIVTIKAGTLDDTRAIKPVAHLWISRKQPWVLLDEGVPAYDTQPPDLKTWREELMGFPAEGS